MGDVWQCTDVLLEREVAVKVLLPSLVSDPEFTTRFRAEAQMMAALRHPGIVQVHDFGVAAMADGGRVSYLVMEYVDGEPLINRIKRSGRLSIAESMSIVAQAAQALHAAHTAGIVHRDVKPGNLLVQRDGTVVLVDFGIARSTSMANITATNMVLGTALYMSPEQAAGQPVSAATDIYALGTVAYYCLAGNPPFTGDNPVQVALQHLRDDPPALPAGIPAPVAALVTRALAKSPADRFRSAADFADAARAAQGAPPPGPQVVADRPLAAPAPASPAYPTPAYPTPAVPPTLPPSAASPTARKTTGRMAALAGIAGTALVALTVLVATMTFQPEADDTLADESSIVTEAPRTEPSTRPADPTSTPKANDTEAATGQQPQPVHPSGAAKPASSVTAKPTTTANSGTTTTPATTTVSNPYTAVQVCGSGYQVIDSASLTANGSRKGRVYLLYNGSNGYNCTVTLKDTAVGTSTTVTAYLEMQGSSRKTDSGSYKYYAGPVTANAASTCVKWGGSAGGVSYNSPFEHCG